MQIFPSATQQDKFNKEINQIAAKFISEKLCPQLDHLVRKAKIGLTASVDETDRHVINIHYPAAFSENYIRPYVFEIFPSVFENADCPVIAIAVERTFWEKATILHQEAHRRGQIPQRYSRHYYDFYQLASKLGPVRSRKTWIVQAAATEAISDR